jgi:hypothetical protein
MRRRIDVEPDDVAQFGGELRIVRQLEPAHPVRLQAVRSPDPLHREDADPDSFRHDAGRPVRRLARRITGRGQRDDLLGDLRAERRNAGRAGLIAQETVHPRVHEAFLSAPDRGLALARPPTVPIGGEKHDPRSPDVLLRAVPIRHHRFQTDPVGGHHFDNDPLAHTANSHTHEPEGIRKGPLSSDFIA